MNRNWIGIKNRNGTENQWKFRTDNECSVQCAWPVIRLHTSWEPLTELPLSVLYFHSISVQFQFNFYSIPVQFLFNFCSISVQFLFNFCSISVRFPFDFCSIELKLNGNQTKSRWVDPLMIVQWLTCPISDELTSDVRKLVCTNSQYFILNYSIIPCPPIINEKVYILLRIHMIQNGLMMV